MWWIQLIISGIAMGLIYGLVAIEFTLIWNSTSLINFAHDKFIMLGAYVFAVLALKFGIPYWVAFLPALFLMAVFGVIVANTIFNPLRNAPSDLFVVAGTLALAQIIIEIVRLIVGPVPMRLLNFFTGCVEVNNIVVSKIFITVIPFVFLFLIFHELFFKKTKLGMSMRAVAKDKMAASLVGINVPLNISFTVAYSSTICCIIGILVSPLFGVWTSMADVIGLKGFAAAVIGGFGSIPGCIVGGLIIGLIETIYAGFSIGVYKDIVAFTLMVLILIIMPMGIFGKIRKK